MTLAAADLLALVLLGGWVAVDGTGWGQFMVSRPLVAATLAGLVVGEPAAGAALGLILEGFQLTVLPVGAARYPEGGPAAVAAAATVALAPLTPASMLTAVAFFGAWQWVSGETIRVQRRTNTRLLTRGEAGGDPAASLTRGHLASLALDFARGMFLVAAGVALLGALQQLAGSFWGIGQRVPQLLLTAVVAGLLASSFRLFGARGRLFVAGAIGGLFFLVIRQ